MTKRRTHVDTVATRHSWLPDRLSMNLPAAPKRTKGRPQGSEYSLEVNSTEKHIVFSIQSNGTSKRYTQDDSPIRKDTTGWFKERL